MAKGKVIQPLPVLKKGKPIKIEGGVIYHDSSEETKDSEDITLVQARTLVFNKINGVIAYSEIPDNIRSRLTELRDVYVANQSEWPRNRQTFIVLIRYAFEQGLITAQDVPGDIDQLVMNPLGGDGFSDMIKSITKWMKGKKKNKIAISSDVTTPLVSSRRTREKKRKKRILTKSQTEIQEYFKQHPKEPLPTILEEDENPLLPELENPLLRKKSSSELSDYFKEYEEGGSVRGDYAKIAKGSYGSQDIEGYSIDRGLSNQNRTTYVKDGKAIVSFRGTDLKTKDNKWKDLGTDALIFFGLERFGSRFKNAVKATEKVVAKYGKSNVTLTGHSLGGSQALYVGKQLGLPVKAFNPGTSPADIIRDKFEAPPTAETKVYTTGIDPISGLSTQLKGVDTELVMPNNLNVHGVSNFYDQSASGSSVRPTNDKEGSGMKYEHWVEIDGHHYHFPLDKFVLKINKPLEGGHIYKLIKQGPDCYDLVNGALGTIHGHCLKEDKAKEQLEMMNKAYDMSLANEKVEKDKVLKKSLIKKNPIKKKRKKMSDSESSTPAPPAPSTTTWRSYWSNYCKGKKFGSRQAVNDAMREAAKEFKSKK